MKSPSATTDFVSVEQARAAPSTQFIRRGFRPVQAPPLDACDVDALGTIARLPLAIQAAFRRKLIAIIALQLFLVTVALAIVEFGSSAVRNWISAHTVDVLAGAVAALVGLLLLLFLVRKRFPSNWLVLVLFSAAQALSLVTVDLMLESHVVFLNCVFTCAAATVMAGMAGWTHMRDRDSCCGLAFQWLPAQDDNHNGPKLWSALAVGGLAFLLTGGLVLLFVALHLFGIHSWPSMELSISFFVQLIIGFWIVYEVDRMHQTQTPDAYMGGVIYLYADLVAVVAALAALSLMCLCAGVASEGGAMDVAEVGAEGCCLGLDVALHSQVREEDV